MIDNIYAFIFRGLLTEEALDKAGRKNKLQLDEFLSEEITQRLGINLMDEDIVAKAKKMAIVYTAISAFENYLRGFVEKKLLEEKGEKWWTLCVPDKIRTAAEIRQREESKTRYQTSRGDALINYVDFGDLISIIQKKENWQYFEPHLGSVDWARQISDTIEKSRHVIMHSGELGDKDIERVGMQIRDWIKQVG